MALFFFLAIIIWFASGYLVGADKKQDGQASDAEIGASASAESSSQPIDAEAKKHVTDVRTMLSNPQDFHRQVTVNGRTIPNRQVVLRAEVKGKVVAVPVAKGDVAKAGVDICRLAIRDREQQVVQGKASVAQADIEYRGAIKLKQRGYQSDAAIAKAKAKLEQAKAQLVASKEHLANTHVKAPFTGFVDSRPVELGDFMQEGDVCAVMVETQPLKVEAFLSEKNIAAVSVGNIAKLTLATGEQRTGKVVYLSQLADDQTRSYAMEIVIPNKSGALRPGIAAKVTVLSDTILAHHIPAAILTLDDEGATGVKVVSDDNRVAFLPVTLLGDDSDGVWVTGLPDASRVIVVGHEYVTAGEVVEASAIQSTPVHSSTLP